MKGEHDGIAYCYINNILDMVNDPLMFVKRLNYVP